MTYSFWIILFAVVLYGALHSWLASLGLKTRMRARFGERADRFYRLLYNLLALVTLLPVLVLPVALVDKEIYRIPFPWIVFTLAGQAAAVVILLAGILQTGVLNFLGICQFIHCEGEDEPRLVVSGLYRWVRHPLYTAGLLFIWLMPAMSWNLLALNIGITFYIFIGAMLEERKLLVEYGSEYEVYRQHTPMLIPGLGGKWSG